MSIDEKALAATLDVCERRDWDDITAAIRYYEAARSAGQPGGITDDWIACSQALSLLTATAARLVRGEGFTSYFGEDHKRHVPKWMLKCLEDDDTRRKSLGNDIANALNVLRPCLRAPKREIVVPASIEIDMWVKTSWRPPMAFYKALFEYLGLSYSIEGGES